MTGLRLSRALRIDQPVAIAIVGAGGKTTSLFQLASELQGRVVVTTTTHLGINQIAQADAHHVIESPGEIIPILAKEKARVILISGGNFKQDRIKGPPRDVIAEIGNLVKKQICHVLVEADGSRGLPIKAPADHEPPIPEWVNQVINIAGLQCIGRLVDSSTVHRPEQFLALSGAKPTDPIEFDDIMRVAINQKGGIKNIPTESKKTLLLNQADVYPQVLHIMQETPRRLWQEAYDQCIVGSIGSQQKVWRAFGKTAAVILAAGGSTRMGGTLKQLLAYQGKPFVRCVCETALAAHLWPVILVTGENSEFVANAVEGLPIIIANNSNWKMGQGSSVATGAAQVPAHHDGVIFLLADIPQVRPEIIHALVEQYETSEADIIFPSIDGKPANPVIFGASTFSALKGLSGDKGGRTLFDKFLTTDLPWTDNSLLLDVDTPEDYRKLLGGAG